MSRHTTTMTFAGMVLACFGLLAACTTDDTLDSEAPTAGNVINIGSSTLTRSDVGAASVDWLKTVLEGDGIGVNYGDSIEYASTLRTATLKYDATNSVYKLLADVGTSKPAQWIGNGTHLFRSVYYPAALQETSFSATDQTGDAYTNMDHYIIMPDKVYRSATVDKIILPYVHRMAKVKLFVLIDPDVMNGSTTAAIKGYSATDGGGSSNTLRIDNVPVLKGVDASGEPTWTVAEHLIPHFVSGTNTVKSNGVTYTNVPEFDFIMRPYYNMYDDAPATTKLGYSTFAVTLALDNGINYNKQCKVALDPNIQMNLYLHISRQQIAFSDSCSTQWNSSYYDEGFYGVDNSGYSLSDAGGSWQRAYRNSTTKTTNSDGTAYQDCQYLTDDNFISTLRTACVGGINHGDYFVLTKDITLPATWEPFAFTGHLDGRGHTISFADGTTATALFTDLNGSYEVSAVGEANVHYENKTYVPIQGYRAEIMNVTMQAGKSLLTGTCSGYLFNNTVTSVSTTTQNEQGEDVTTTSGTLFGTLDATYGHVVNCRTLTQNP